MARLPRRRGRTALLIATAAVLGVVAGTVTGYAVQYDREPTALPPLSQPELRNPKAVPRGANTTAQSLNANRRFKADGDLRKLLVKKPKGARADKSQTEGWKGLLEFAEEYKEPDGMFTSMTDGDFRRIATTSWEERGEVFVTVNLIQFRDARDTYAAEWATDQHSYQPQDKWAGNDGKPIPGSGNGRVYIYDEPYRQAGYEPLYRSRVIAQRGSVVMDISYRNNSRPISAKALMALAKQQLERL